MPKLGPQWPDEINNIPRARVHEILVGARNLLDQVGWTKGWNGIGNGGTCIMGLVGAASRFGWAKRHLVIYAPEGMACARAIGFYNTTHAIKWNDSLADLNTVRDLLDLGIKATAPEPEEPELTELPELPELPEPALVA